MKSHEKYYDFYAPEAIIFINDKNVSKEGISITELSVQQTLDGASTFSFTVANALDYEYNRKYKKILDFGDKVEIKIGYKDSFSSILVGIITSLSWNFTEGNYLDISVEGQDYLFLLMKNSQKKKPWLKKTDGQVVKDMMKHSIYKVFKKKEIFPTQIEYPHIQKKDEESDYDFIVKKLAKRNGLEVISQKNNFYFREPPSIKNDTFLLTYGETLLTFTPKFNLTKQVSKVEVTGWNPSNRKKIIGKASLSVKKDKKNSQPSIESLIKEEITHKVKAPVHSQKEADLLAQSILSDISNKLITGSATAVGMPDFKPGIVVKLEKLGEYFSRNYYVDTVTHSFNDGAYSMSFTVKGNS